MSESGGIRVNLDDIMGYTEAHSRWEPCNCGDGWCGHFVNWTVKVDRYGNRTENPEWIGVRTVCPGPQKRSWFRRVLDLLIKH